MTSPGTYPIEPFGRQHNREAFRSGNEELDRYFRERVRKDVEAGVAAAFVMADGPLVMGYYTLSAFGVERGELPESVTRKPKLPKYPVIPATLMGRLAVDVKQQGKGVGEILLMDALERSYIHARDIASFAVVVDAKEEAAGFYRRYRFEQLPGSNRMFLAMATIGQLLTERS